VIELKTDVKQLVGLLRSLQASGGRERVKSALAAHAYQQAVEEGFRKDVPPPADWYHNRAEEILAGWLRERANERI
jgi:hypothetical protein